jgi:hypothetical protein
MATKSDDLRKPKNLTPAQLAAVDALASGTSVTAAAEAVSVSRQTVSVWLHHDPAFQAAVNARRQELWEESSNRLRALAPQALDVLADWMKSHKGLEAAVHVLKAAGLYGLSAPVGSTHADELEAEEEGRRWKLFEKSMGN